MHAKESQFVIADNSNSFVTIICKNSWKTEAVDQVVAVSNLVAIRSLQLRNGSARELFFDSRYSEIFWKSAEFGEKRTVLFKKFTSMSTRIAKIGVDAYIKAYEAFNENDAPPVTPQRRLNGSLPQV